MSRSAIAANLLLLLLPLTATAGKSASGADHVNHFREPGPKVEDGISFTAENAIARPDMAKLALSIDNGTDDWVLVEMAETSLAFEHGTYPNMRRSNRTMRIPPKGKKKPTVEVGGRDDLHVDAYSVVIGGVSKVDGKGKPVTVEPFSVPPSSNSVEAGPFSCSMAKLKKSTRVTEATFECVYSGSKVGLIDASRLAWRIESGQEFANFDRKAGQDLIFPGEKIKISAVAQIEGRVVDMQFANMSIVWNDTFAESDRKGVAPVKIELQIDPGETAGKN
jgi:hypothetical protein